MSDNPNYRKLPADVKARWLEALRSGRYLQTKGRLHRTEDGAQNCAGYCCLGVLCDLMSVPEQQVTELWGTNGSTSNLRLPFTRFTYKGTSSSDVLPYALAHELGISAGGTLNTPIPNPHGSDFTSLWELNDNAGYDFARIADVIEEQF